MTRKILLVLITNNNTSVITTPIKKIIKSMGLKNPKINFDFFELAGIK